VKFFRKNGWVWPKYTAVEFLVARLASQVLRKACGW
jgi:hypothetical protein